MFVKKNPTKGHRETLGDVYVYYLDSSDGNTSICIYLNSQNSIHYLYVAFCILIMVYNKTGGKEKEKKSY